MVVEVVGAMVVVVVVVAAEVDVVVPSGAAGHDAATRAISTATRTAPTTASGQGDQKHCDNSSNPHPGDIGKPGYPLERRAGRGYPRPALAHD